MNIDPKGIIEECAEMIDRYADQISLLTVLSEELKLPINAAPLVNFRDALNHYKILYENRENPYQLLGQKASIEEHLTRGLKDVLLHFAILLRKRLEEAGETNTVLLKSQREQNRLRKIIHKLKNLNLDIRIKSAAYSLSDFQTAPQVLAEVIVESRVLFQEWRIPGSLTTRSKIEK